MFKFLRKLFGSKDAFAVEHAAAMDFELPPAAHVAAPALSAKKRAELHRLLTAPVKDNATKGKLKPNVKAKRKRGSVIA